MNYSTTTTSTTSTTTNTTPFHLAAPSKSSCYRIFNEEHFDNANRSLLLVCLAFSFFFINISNFLLIHGLWKTKKHFTTTTKLFIFLSCSDLVTGVITCPMQILMITLGVRSTCLQVGIQAFFNAFTPLLSMFTLLTISSLRYNSMQSPLKRMKESQVFVWLALGACIALLLTSWYTDISQKSEVTLSLGIFLIVVTALCVLINGASVAINTFLHFVLSKKKPIRRNSTVTQTSQRNATNTLLILSVMLVLCYFPNGVAFGIIGYHVIGKNTVKSMYREYIPWAHIPMVLNAGINSFVYIIRNRRIKQYYLDIICCRQRKKESFQSEFNQSMQPINPDEDSSKKDGICARTK